MTNDQLYSMILEDFISGDIYDPQAMIKDLVMLLDQTAVDKFAEDYQFEEGNCYENSSSKD